MRRSSALLAAVLLTAVPTCTAAAFAQSGTIPPCASPRALPVHLSIWPPCPQPADTVFLRASSPCELCLDVQDIVYVPNRGWVVRSTSGPLEVCDVIQCIAPDEVMVPIGRLAAGHHRILVTKENVVTDSLGTSCLITEQTALDFDVGADCPPPPSDTLQYVDRVQIGEAPCATCPPQACADREIPVSLGGTIAHSCYEFRRVELFWPAVTHRDPTVIGPPIVRVVFATKDCFVTPCLPAEVPWNGGVRLPPLPAGQYDLRVESAILVRCGTDSALTVTGAEVFPFEVRADCPPPPDRCMWLSWGSAGNECNAEVGPGEPASLTLLMRATEPIAGFQGKLFLKPFGLEVKDVKATGVAAGMQVLWNRTSSGAFFVLYSETGQLLPPCNPYVRCVGCCISSPVLEVIVAAQDGAHPAPVTELLVWEVGGADSLGGEIRTCVRAEDDRRAMIARICLETPCDANGDRHTDIRDLVTMVRCINDPEGCAADTAGTPLDCEGDGDLDLADVICCAHFILRGQLPDTAETVPAPEVYLRFGEALRTAAGVDVPIAVHGGSRLSAARLGLSVPLEQFSVGGLIVEGAAQDWLALHETTDDGVSLGLVRVDTSPTIPEDPGTVNAVLHLTLKPGAAIGGEVRLEDGDFTGAEGEGLIPGESDRSVSLAAAGSGDGLTLAPPRPNPFTREATFALSLERDADVELTVHDLSGRRVATLHAGRLAAGSHAFVWSGRTPHGAAANGLYFVRARVDGRIFSQKVALLRGR